MLLQAVSITGFCITIPSMNRSSPPGRRETRPPHSEILPRHPSPQLRPPGAPVVTVPTDPVLEARYAPFDMLATLVSVVNPEGAVLFANAALEDALGHSRHTLLGTTLASFFARPGVLLQAIRGASSNDYAALRYEARLMRQGQDPLPVHVVVAQTDDPDQVIVELLPLEAQVRHDREDRMVTQSMANKTLVRSLAHEIKNPLGGLRGAAQLLEMDLPDPALKEYTQVIIREADRLQALVDRLLAPHRSAPTLGEVNIHEVCERVRALIVAEFPHGLTVVRDYDTSITEFRGDREHLIQAVLNIAHNAAQALGERIARGDARITLRTRVARQVTLGKQRHKLALELLVIDNGPGIPADIVEQIFFPLVTGRANGTGLGLTLAQTYVQQHHGLIECESEPGQTIFRVLIPLL